MDRSGIELLSCVKAFNIKAVKICISNGADVNACDQHMDSCAQIAVQTRQLDVLKLLLKTGSVDFSHVNSLNMNIEKTAYACMIEAMHAHEIAPSDKNLVERKILDAVERRQRAQEKMRIEIP